MEVTNEAALQASYLASSKVRFARTLRPHAGSRLWHFSALERFGERASLADRLDIDKRGPAAYSPQWRVSSAVGESRGAFFTADARFRGPRAVGGAQLQQTGDMRSSIGVQPSSERRSKPSHSFGTGGRTQWTTRSKTPGPGHYNA